MPKEITLPSGKKAVIADGKGKHLFQAQKMASSPDEIQYALIAILTTIDGEPVIYEDMAEMNLPDVLCLVVNSGMNDFLSLQPNTLSTSAATQAGATGKSQK